MIPDELRAIRQAWDPDANAWDIIALHVTRNRRKRDEAVVHAAAFVGGKAQRDIAALVAEVERLKRIEEAALALYLAVNDEICLKADDGNSAIEAAMQALWTAREETRS